MENKLNNECTHIMYFETHFDSLNFCTFCGCIILNDDNNFTIKPITYNNPLNESPIKVIDKLITSLPLEYKEDNLEYAKNRRNYIEYLAELRIEYDYSFRIYFYSVFLLDYILVYKYRDLKEYIDKCDIEVITVACFVLAIKFIQNGNDIPRLDGFRQLKHKTLEVDISVVLEYEIIVLKLLKYKLDYISPYDVLQTIKTYGFIFTKDVSGIKDKIFELYDLTEQLIILFSEHNEYYKFNGFQISVACITFAFDTLKMNYKINKHIEKLYHFNQFDISKCYLIID